MALANEDVLEFVSGGRLPILRATTKHLSLLSPMGMESGLTDWSGRKVPGLPIGTCGSDGLGGMFMYDPFMLHKARRTLRNGKPVEPVLPNLNGIVLGDVGMWKSGLVKNMAYLGTAAGYPFLITDIKGEYKPLVAAIPGAKELMLGNQNHGERQYINPLDPLIPADIQNKLISSLAITVMGRMDSRLDVEERSLLREAIKAAKAKAEYRHHPEGTRPAQVPVLADLIDMLFEPTEAMAHALRQSHDEMRRTGRPMALALLELTEGDLQGMVDQPTSEGFFTDTPLLVLNLRGLQNEALAIMVIVINYLMASQFGKSSALGRFRWIIHDETWKLASFPGFVMSLTEAFKLGRSERVANWIVFHHLKDLWRTSQQDLTEGLFADAATRVIHHTDRQELMLAADALNLNETVLERIPNLPAGTAIWQVGKYFYEVEHQITPEVLPLVDTSSLDQDL